MLFNQTHSFRAMMNAPKMNHFPKGHIIKLKHTGILENASSILWEIQREFFI